MYKREARRIFIQLWKEKKKTVSWIFYILLLLFKDLLWGQFLLATTLNRRDKLCFIVLFLAYVSWFLINIMPLAGPELLRNGARGSE